MHFRIQAWFALAAGLLLAVSVAAHAADPLTVKTEQGKVHGKVLNLQRLAALRFRNRGRGEAPMERSR